MRLQEIERNPLDVDDVAMFEVFERKGWPHERRRACILDQARLAAAIDRILSHGSSMSTRPDEPSTVIPASYPQLSRLAWNRDPSRPISGREALGLYETNWRHVDVAALGREELDLIRTLVDRYGNGHLLATR